MTYEQSAQGDSLIIGDQKVYLSHNIDRYVACWNERNCTFEINCKADQATLVDILKYIIKGGT